MSGPNGILSSSDKEYLASMDPRQDVVWSGDEAQKRFRMREKIKAALLDFPGISGLPREEYELIFKDLRDVNPGPIRSAQDQKTGEMITVDWEADQYEALKHMLVFVYEACRLEPAVDFETLLETAIRWAEETRLENENLKTDRALSSPKSVDNVTAAINISYHEQPSVEDIKAKLERNEGLGLDEIGLLALMGELNDIELSPFDLDRRLRQQAPDPNGFPGLAKQAGIMTYEFEEFTDEYEEKRRRGEVDEPAQVTERLEEDDEDDGDDNP